IFKAQGQTQILDAERAADPRGVLRAPGDGQELAPTVGRAVGRLDQPGRLTRPDRSEEHTSELQSRENLVCRLLLEKKKTEQERLRSGGTQEGHERSGVRLARGG